VHRSGSNSVKGDRETSTKLEPLLAGPLITETPKLQAVSANTSAMIAHDPLIGGSVLIAFGAFVGRMLFKQKPIWHAGPEQTRSES
jgi:hypothetical protein